MALNSKVGTFQMRASTGTQSVTGLGFTPKALIFMMTPNTTDIDAPDLTANGYGTIGFADGTRQCAATWFTPNGAASSAYYFMQASNRCILGMINASSSFSASLTSLDADGFTITVNQAPGDTWQVGYMALGGADLNAYAGNFTTAATLTQQITGVGFQPSALIAFTFGNGTAFSETTITSAVAPPTFGISDGTNDYCISTYIANGATTMNTECYQSNASFLADVASNGLLAFEGNIQGFEADGFLISWPNTDANRKVIYLALGGVLAKALDFQLNTTTGSQSVTGVGFQPGAIIIGSTGQAAYNTFSGSGDGAKFVAGMGTASTEQFSFGDTYQDNVADSNDDHYQHSTHLARVGDFAQGTEEQISLSSMDGGGFTFNVDTALGASPSSFFALALESQFSGGDGGTGSGSGGTASKDASFMFGWIGA